MKSLLIAAAFGFALGNVASAATQSYPARPITIVVTFPAGGPTDMLSRILADRMKTTLGQPIIVENVSGAGGTIGVARVARATADGSCAS